MFQQPFSSRVLELLKSIICCNEFDADATNCNTREFIIGNKTKSPADEKLNNNSVTIDTADQSYIIEPP